MHDDEREQDSGMGEDTSQGGDTGPIEEQGGEGRQNQEATPPITEQEKTGQTQHDAPDDDVGGQQGGQDRTD
ncbi:MAG: hypothetical protein ACR2K9_07120 [Solirubrobacteraceae bacterium]